MSTSVNFSGVDPFLNVLTHAFPSVLFSDEERCKASKTSVSLSQMIKPYYWLSGGKIRFLSQLFWVTIVKFLLPLDKSDF